LFPLRRAQDIENFQDGLRKAGLPDWSVVGCAP